MQNILFIKLSTVIWEFQIQVTEAQIMTSYFIGIPPPLQEEVGGKNQEWQDMTGQEMHTQSVTKITLRVCKYFLPHFFILWLAGVHTPGHTQDVGQGVVNGPNKHSKGHTWADRFKHGPKGHTHIHTLTRPYKYTHTHTYIAKRHGDSRSHWFEGLSEAVALLETVPLVVLSECVYVLWKGWGRDSVFIIYTLL